MYEGGLTVRTTLDPRLQKIAEKSLRDGLEVYDRRHGWRGPITKLTIGNDWQEQLKKTPKVPGRGKYIQVVVLETNKGAAEIGFEDGTKGKITLDELQWARKFISPIAMGPAVAIQTMPNPQSIWRLGGYEPAYRKSIGYGWWL